jgi:hypothetical protein
MDHAAVTISTLEGRNSQPSSIDELDATQREKI